MPRPPKKFHHFIGQRRAVRQTAAPVAGAKSLGRACPHVLLASPTVSGKTALAEATALAYGSTFCPLLAGANVSAAGVVAVLHQLRHGEVFFIDEAHALKSDAQKVLYVAIDKSMVPNLADGTLNWARLESVASFTLIAATNEPEALRKAFRNRLIRVAFEPYSLGELKAISDAVARKEGMGSPQAARRLAELARGSPRQLDQLVHELRLLSPGQAAFGQKQVEGPIASNGFDWHGLSPHQRQCLYTLADGHQRTRSLRRLAIKLGCDERNIEAAIEPALFDQGLVEVASGRGRELTAVGLQIVADLLMPTGHALQRHHQRGDRP
jgi:Holliday junction resolvasome RuvABC ATP-dependent DNA helicase subunit